MAPAATMVNPLRVQALPAAFWAPVEVLAGVLEAPLAADPVELGSIGLVTSVGKADATDERRDACQLDCRFVPDARHSRRTGKVRSTLLVNGTTDGVAGKGTVVVLRGDLVDTMRPRDGCDDQHPVTDTKQVLQSDYALTPCCIRYR